MEIFGSLKKVIFFQWIIIGAMLIIIAAQSFYHDYKWSEFDTVVLDECHIIGNVFDNPELLEQIE